MDESLSRSEFLKLAGICEGSLFAIALVLAWFMNVNPGDQLYFDWWSVLVGTVAAIPLLVLFGVLYRLDLPPLRRIRDLLHQIISPQLADCRPIDIVLLAVLAGLCEEVLFRGTLQLWLSQWGLPAGIAGVSLLFGLVHCVTPTYVVLAGLIGAYLSWSMYFVDRPNLLIPIVTHAVYDYVGFLVLVAEYRRGDAARIATTDDL